MENHHGKVWIERGLIVNFASKEERGHVPISQAAEIPNKIKSELIAILREAGAPI